MKENQHHYVSIRI